MTAPTETEAATETTLPCAVCLKPQEALDGDPEVPYAANIFTSTGHYGSTAFDAVFGGERLELLICTPCMKAMRSNAAIQRIFEATEATPEEQVFIWGSADDTAGDNPKNEKRLRNEAAMERFAEATPGMTKEWFHLLFGACTDASRAGKAFNPAAISAPAKEQTVNA